MMLPLIQSRGASQEQMKLTLLVPDASVSFLIGKKGSSVNEIQSQSQTVLSFVKPHEMQSSRIERALSVVGETESILKALSLILELLEQFRTTGPSEGGGGGGGGYASHPPPPPLPPRPTYGRIMPPAPPQYVAQHPPRPPQNGYNNVGRDDP